MLTEIPKGAETSLGPCWVPRHIGDRILRPFIVCRCNRACFISLHHVHADGTVTASFFHDTEPHPEIGYVGGGCGWHVFLKLANYGEGEFPPEKMQ